jgi:hypothetical protein
VHTLLLREHGDGDFAVDFPFTHPVASELDEVTAGMGQFAFRRVYIRGNFLQASP